MFYKKKNVQQSNIGWRWIHFVKVKIEEVHLYFFNRPPPY
jgi:hypothetical protein